MIRKIEKERGTDMAQKKRNGKLLIKVILIALAAVVSVAVILTVISATTLRSTYESLIEETIMTASHQLNSEMSSVWDGEWDLDGESLLKGGTDVTQEYQNLMDELKSRTGLDYTIFYGKTRRVTTLMKKSGGRLVGTDASDAVQSAVLGQGKTYYAPNITIEGSKYYGYYVPIYQPGTKEVVGMSFSGRLSEDVNAEISRNVITMVLIATLLVAVIAALGMLVALKTSKKMAGIATSINDLASGDLKVELDESLLARHDELGTIADSTRQFKDKIAEVIGTTRRMSQELHSSSTELTESAGQASTASSQVSEAVNEVSRGAVSQAESIQTAAANTDGIGRNIDDISDNVSQLDEYTGQMKKSCDDAMEAMEKLISQSQEVMASVKEIDNTIHSTNESAKGISQFSDAITDIAEETNLLSLNASIEAARAGEAGKGFAVVASQIQKLADQSKNSADQIKDIVEKLLADSDASVEVMNRLNENFAAQGEQLSSTQQDMQDMSINVKNVETSSKQISDRVRQLNDAKMSLVEIIQDLSAISEENAASTEETNASMQELNATFSVISESAQQLQVLADNLQETISYFQD